MPFFDKGTCNLLPTLKKTATLVTGFAHLKSSCLVSCLINKEEHGIIWGATLQEPRTQSPPQQPMKLEFVCEDPKEEGCFTSFYANGGFQPFPLIRPQVKYKILILFGLITSDYM